MSNLPVRAYLAHFDMFASLQTDALESISAASEMMRAPRNGYIFLADEPSNFLFLLLKGSVKIGMYAPDGREVIKCIQHPNSIFGEFGLTGEQFRSDFACAMNQEVWYLRIPVDTFQSVMCQNHELTRAVLQHLGERLRRAERQCESLILKDVRTRIVEFLKENADEYGRKVGFDMMIKHGLTQQDIANLVGASRQTVAAILNDLRKSNLIHFNRHTILIRDMDKLN
ncbi:MAG: Crp/Fnr family transcriptional regulator [Lewinellaceae bacterium]|nr:Crp/Fnr family transcriptional regulator [Lewinellaceae bacterium]